MTVEEAIFCEKSYIGETNCTDCKYYGTDTCQSRESHRMSIKALEQGPILDRARAEIESQRKEVSNKNSENEELTNYYYGLNDGLKDARDIIDKYRRESENV